MNDNQTLTREEREQLERFREHQARFDHRALVASFCRWMAMRFGNRDIDGKPRKPPVSLSAARTSKSRRRRSSDALND
jgi:hypothetical protein